MRLDLLRFQNKVKACDLGFSYLKRQNVSCPKLQRMFLFIYFFFKYFPDVVWKKMLTGFEENNNTNTQQIPTYFKHYCPDILDT